MSYDLLLEPSPESSLHVNRIRCTEMCKSGNRATYTNRSYVHLPCVDQDPLAYVAAWILGDLQRARPMPFTLETTALLDLGFSDCNLLGS
jgi:hypothetical protein